MIKKLYKYVLLILIFCHENLMAHDFFDFSKISSEKIISSYDFFGASIEQCKKILLLGIEISVENIVNANTTRSSDEYFPYKYKYLIISLDFSFLVMEKEKYKKIYNPIHPDSIKNGELKGFVLYPDINIRQEYSDIMEMITLLRLLDGGLSDF
jgi:hypothetical protein